MRYYLTAGGESPFGSWFSDLDAAAAAKVTVALVRLKQGNTSNAKGVGEGVLEYRINWGPGYRVYFGRDGETPVILLTGGTKQRQQRDIERAKELWADYKRRRKPPGGFRREVQPRRQHWFLNEKSGFPFRTPAFCSVSRGRRRLGEKEYRAPSVTPGGALRPRTQGAVCEPCRSVPWSYGASANFPPSLVI